MRQMRVQRRARSGGVRLRLWCCAAEGVQFCTGLLDRYQRRIGCQVNLETARIEHLRDQATIRQPRCIPDTETTARCIVRPHGRQLLFQRSETELDPMGYPGIFLYLWNLKLVFEVAQDAQIVERMYIAGDFERELPRPRTLQ